MKAFKYNNIYDLAVAVNLHHSEIGISLDDYNVYNGSFIIRSFYCNLILDDPYPKFNQSGYFIMITYFYLDLVDGYYQKYIVSDNFDYNGESVSTD